MQKPSCKKSNQDICSVIHSKKEKTTHNEPTPKPYYPDIVIIIINYVHLPISTLSQYVIISAA